MVPTFVFFINGAYTRMLRASLNVHWSQRVKNTELHNDLPKITETICYCRLKFSGHIWRHDEETAHNLVFFGCQQMEKTKEEGHRKHVLTNSLKTKDYRCKNLKP